MTRSALITIYNKKIKLMQDCNAFPLLRNALHEGNLQNHVPFMEDACLY
jgi:hypothetical protein